MPLRMPNEMNQLEAVDVPTGSTGALGDEADTSTIFVIGSAGAVLSEAVKTRRAL